jgi:hypothetical protein
MRFDLATIAFVGAWAFNVHPTPVYTSVAWDEYQPVDIASIQPAVDSDDSMQLQAMLITEMLSTATSNDIDELIGKNDVSVNISGDTNNMHLGSLAQDRVTASVVREADLPSNYYKYYYLALVPLGILGFTIFQGWRESQEERTRALHASRQARTRRVRI